MKKYSNSFLVRGRVRNVRGPCPRTETVYHLIPHLTHAGRSEIANDTSTLCCVGHCAGPQSMHIDRCTSVAAAAGATDCRCTHTRISARPVGAPTCAHIARTPPPRCQTHPANASRCAMCGGGRARTAPHEPKLRPRSSFNDHSSLRLMGARARSHTGFAHTSTAREGLDRSSIPRVRYAQQRDVARARLSGPRTTQPATRSRGGRISATR